MVYLALVLFFAWGLWVLAVGVPLSRSSSPISSRFLLRFNRESLFHTAFTVRPSN